jgi:hypothetical protein
MNEYHYRINYNFKRKDNTSIPKIRVDKANENNFKGFPDGLINNVWSY